jgi:hypothetical protein
VVTRPDRCFEVLRTRAIPGRTIDELTRDGRAADVPLLRCLAMAVRLDLRGMAHRDLGGENVIVDAEGGLHPVDFGLAAPSGRWAALAADVVGVGPQHRGGSIRQIAREVLVRRDDPVARLVQRAYGARTRSRQRRGEEAAAWQEKRHCVGSFAGVEELRQAWTVDRRRGEGPSSWGFEIAGQQGVGGRGFETLWERLRPLGGWTGRRLVEVALDLPLASALGILDGASEAIVVGGSDRVAPVRSLAAAFGVSERTHVVVADPAAPVALPPGDVAVLLGRRVAQLTARDPAILDRLAAFAVAVVECPPGDAGEVDRRLAGLGFDWRTPVPLEDGATVIHAARRRDDLSPGGTRA